MMMSGLGASTCSAILIVIPSISVRALARPGGWSASAVKEPAKKKTAKNFEGARSRSPMAKEPRA